MTDLTIDEKRIYISKNVNLIENHKKIIDFVFFYKIIYSENNNGFLINISKLNDKIINELYKVIFNIIEKNCDYDYFDKEEIKDYLIIQNSNNEKNDNKFSDILLSDFTPKEKEIIKLSKNYKFE